VVSLETLDARLSPPAGRPPSPRHSQTARATDGTGRFDVRRACGRLGAAPRLGQMAPRPVRVPPRIMLTTTTTMTAPIVATTMVGMLIPVV
jgi:hypothetical protein